MFQTKFDSDPFLVTTYIVSFKNVYYKFITLWDTEYCFPKTYGIFLWSLLILKSNFGQMYRILYAGIQRIIWFWYNCCIYTI